jgi:hypothetical protein
MVKDGGNRRFEGETLAGHLVKECGRRMGAERRKGNLDIALVMNVVRCEETLHDRVSGKIFDDRQKFNPRINDHLDGGGSLQPYCREEG